jgi:NAD(P)-dependent dehydrogenase (short-subunit alcohol dehydrogenase family)
MRDVAGKVALVTGGASGIGLGMAQAFAGADMRVVIADVDHAAADAAARELDEGGAEVMAAPLDVTQAFSWSQALGAVEARFGAVDVLCNNAGVSQGWLPGRTSLQLVDISEDYWRLILDTNVTGAYLGVRAVAPGMIRRGGGHIVNTASMAGLVAPPGMSAYSASKFALVGLSESLRGELAPHGVGVSVMCPGSVRSNLTATTAARRASAVQSGSEAESRLVSESPVTGAGMTARAAGERVLRAIRENAFYIVTHPEYGPLIEERLAAVRSAVGESAQPGHCDSADLLQLMRNPLYAEIANRPS